MWNRLFIILLLVISTQSLLSQARIGKTYSEVKEEFQYMGIEDIKTDNNRQLLGYKNNNNVSVFYYFKYNKCINTVIYTKNADIAYDIVAMYDNIFICLEKDLWKLKTPSQDLFVTFDYNIREDYYTFTWE